MAFADCSCHDIEPLDLSSSSMLRAGYLPVLGRCGTDRAACTQRNTVVRIATDTQDPMTGRSGIQVGDILGEYYSAPDGCRQVSTGIVGPSRTSFDFDNSVSPGAVLLEKIWV